MRVRFCLLLLMVTSFLSLSAQTPYHINFPKLGGGQIKMNSYAGKKILVTVFKITELDLGHLKKVDSIYKANKDAMHVIAVPFNDYGSSFNNKSLHSLLKDTLRFQFEVAEISRARKGNSQYQHPLLKWLTHLEENTHFKGDITEDGQIFLISAQGHLYAQLRKHTLLHILSSAIRRKE